MNNFPGISRWKKQSEGKRAAHNIQVNVITTELEVNNKGQQESLK